MLKELLKDKTADDILKLHICEPAMGSAAFLNEAINQLAERYLDLKQTELDQRIPHDDFLQEKQKVKMYIADRNVFGIDLNPVAVELAEVSLWLNCIYGPQPSPPQSPEALTPALSQGEREPESSEPSSRGQGGEGGRKRAFVPWFGMQLHCGNSLIGARRQVYDTTLIPRRPRQKTYWYDQEPKRVLLPEPIPAGHVYHFLLPDFGMADYKDRVIRSLAPQQIDHINTWRKEFCKEPWDDFDVDRLLSLSQRIDDLWQRHAKELREMRQRTTDPLEIWGAKGSGASEAPDPCSTLGMKDKILLQEQHSEGVSHSSAYRRLKLVMDYWCALWFWPIQQGALLPNRQEYLMELAVILGDVEMALEAEKEGQLPLFPETNATQAKEVAAKYGFVSVPSLCERFPRLQLVNQIAQEKHFFHWELEFADIFTDNGGFDLILGNPPWIKVTWNEGNVLSDAEPVFDLRKFSADKLSKLREQAFFDHRKLKNEYFYTYEEMDGFQGFLGAKQNYFLLQGITTNLYKCFLPQAWLFSNSLGAQGLIHQESVYDDPKGGSLREALYSRLRFHGRFENELQLFADVGHARKYGINVYRNPQEISFFNIANLFIPKTIDICFEHDGRGPVPGIKDDSNDWEVTGHQKRIINIDESALELFSRLYGEEDTLTLQARLPALHAQPLLEALKKLSQHEKRLDSLNEEYCSFEMWNETNSQKNGTLARKTHFPESPKKCTYSGPHIFVGNPFYKTPRAICTEKNHYDIVDLTSIPDDYLPRSNYQVSVEPSEYFSRTPKVGWQPEKTITNFYRVGSREMLSQLGERTFIPCLLPKGIGHINTCISTVFKNMEDVVDFLAMGSSLSIDFFVKTTGMGHANQNILKLLPLIQDKFLLKPQLRLRTLSLNCLTTHYTQGKRKKKGPVTC